MGARPPQDLREGEMAALPASSGPHPRGAPSAAVVEGCGSGAAALGFSLLGRPRGGVFSALWTKATGAKWSSYASV
jgi:hypothetical protein